MLTCHKNGGGAGFKCASWMLFKDTEEYQECIALF